jgi:hypothetical protein
MKGTDKVEYVFWERSCTLRHATIVGEPQNYGAIQKASRAPPRSVSRHRTGERKHIVIAFYVEEPKLASFAGDDCDIVGDCHPLCCCFIHSASPGLPVNATGSKGESYLNHPTRSARAR